MEQIRPFKFSIVMPVFFIKKKNGFLRLMQDYKTFSIIIIKNKYLLSVISQLVTKLLQRIFYLTKLDICWRFNNICIKPRNKQKVIFYINYRLFKPLVMFFSMTNSSTMFQTMINDIFWNFIEKDIIIVYLNNILIFTQILEEYYRAICKVIEVLAKHKLFSCLKKYEFGQQWIKYLDLVILEDQVEIDPIKIAKVQD